jgi:hypothetical protein
LTPQPTLITPNLQLLPFTDDLINTNRMCATVKKPPSNNATFVYGIENQLITIPKVEYKGPKPWKSKLYCTTDIITYSVKLVLWETVNATLTVNYTSDPLNLILNLTLGPLAHERSYQVELIRYNAGG